MGDLREELKECLAGRVCVMGLGNVDYGDDGVGAHIADELASRVSGVVVVNAGAMPERFINGVIDGGYTRLLFIDAVEFGSDPGAVVLLDAGEIEAKFPQISTHKISVGLLAKLAEDKGAKARLLGIQPGSIRAGAGMSPAVRKTADIVVGLLCDAVDAGKQEVLI